jgi:tetratricopeptide (TPR) repeat protein
MSFADRIEALCDVFRGDSDRGARLRRRAAALTGMATFPLMLLAIVGLVQVVLVVVGLAALCMGSIGGVLLARRHSEQLVRLRGGVSGRAKVLRASLAATSARALATCIRAATRFGASAQKSWRHLMTVTTHASGNVRVGTSLLEGHGPARPKRTPIVRHREALRANAAGVQLRRDGAYEQAAEQHRLALALFRDLGDRRSEALTLNNLALALDRSDDIAALDLFEEAATILGELGDEQHEGQVIANLALAFRRRGRAEQSAQVFDDALGKLSPESQEYRTVERLRRAS